MPRVVVSPEADADIDDAAHYIAQGGIDAAVRFVDRLDAKLKLLAWMPNLGQARPELASGVRSLPFGKYLIIYRLVIDGIEVVRVLHGARDLRRIFRRRKP
jgi:toxin ParE1/3/4